jgi:hypothetical protein
MTDAGRVRNMGPVQLGRGASIGNWVSQFNWAIQFDNCNCGRAPIDPYTYDSGRGGDRGFPLLVGPCSVFSHPDAPAFPPFLPQKPCPRARRRILP